VGVSEQQTLFQPVVRLSVARAVLSGLYSRDTMRHAGTPIIEHVVEDARTMYATEKRMGFALLFAAGVIVFNVFMVLTGAAGDLYDRLPGSAPQHEVQAPFEGA